MNSHNTRTRPRLLSRIFGNLATHSVLIAGVAIFLFPFLWMLSTSLKTDEELPAAAVLPSIPTFQARSPYIKDIPRPGKPIDVPDDEWDRLLPALLERAEAAVASAHAAGAIKPVGDTVDAEPLQKAAARFLVDSVAVKMNRALWTGPRDAFDAAFNALLTPEAATAALDGSVARIEWTGVQLRTLDTEIHVLTPGPQMAGALRVVSGPASIERTGKSALLQYHFEPTTSPPTASQPIVLQYDFTFPDGASVENMHKLMVSLKADNSWHRVDATLDMEGQRWVSQRTMPIAQHRPMSLIFQPPTFDDTTDRARTWVPMRLEQNENTSAKELPRRAASLRLIISPSSTMVANYVKAERNYERAFNAVPFWRYLFNSLLLVGLSTFGALFSASFVAYAFARLHWPGRGVAFLLLLATMMLPSQVTMIPSFMIWRQLGWYNTLNPLWVPSWFGAAFFIFLMVQHMKTIPKELEEAARLDGLNALQSWYYIILPQVKPTLAAIAILSFMGAWNEFMGPLIYLRDQAKFPLSLGLFGMRVDQGGVSDWTMMMAGNVLMTVPVIVIFFLFQRYFIQGMTMSGMKG